MREREREGKMEKRRGREERKKEEERNIQRSRDNSLSSIEIYRPNREIFNASVSASREPPPLEHPQ